MYKTDVFEDQIQQILIIFIIQIKFIYQKL